MTTDIKHAERWLEHFREVRGGADSFSRIQAVNWGELEWLNRTHHDQYAWILQQLTINELVAIQWVPTTEAVGVKLSVSDLQKLQKKVFKNVLEKVDDEAFDRTPGPSETFRCEVPGSENCFRMFVMAEAQSAFWLNQMELVEAMNVIATTEPDELDRMVSEYLADQ